MIEYATTGSLKRGDYVRITIPGVRKVLQDDDGRLYVYINNRKRFLNDSISHDGECYVGFRLYKGKLGKLFGKDRG